MTSLCVPDNRYQLLPGKLKSYFPDAYIVSSKQHENMEYWNVLQNSDAEFYFWKYMDPFIKHIQAFTKVPGVFETQKAGSPGTMLAYC